MIKEKRKKSEPIDFDMVVNNEYGKEYILGSVKTIKTVTDTQISYCIIINGLQVRKMVFGNDQGKTGNLLWIQNLER